MPILFHPPLSLRCGLKGCVVGADPMSRERLAPRSLLGGVVGGVMTDSFSPAAGLFPSPLLVSVSALSDITEVFEAYVESLSWAACRPRPEDNADDCVGLCCDGGDRDGVKAEPEVVGGDLCRFEGFLRCIPVLSS